jgi:hypothetical protein
MIGELPAMKMPSWLGDADPATFAKRPFPLEEILADSVYYPCSEFDGRPIAHLAGNYFSFIYVDYGKTRDEFMANLSQPGFRGYQVISQRSVTERELVPHGCTPIKLLPSDGDPRRKERWVEKPFYEWMVLERDQDRPDSYGPSRFSLLHLCAEGVAAFHALYLGNQRAPAAVAIIQPGSEDGFTTNWTNFADPTKIFARSVLGNPAGKPDVLLWGGYGRRLDYMESCWPDHYSKRLLFLDNTPIGVWQR